MIGVGCDGNTAQLENEAPPAECGPARSDTGTRSPMG